MGVVPVTINGKDYELDCRSLGMEIDSLLPETEPGVDASAVEVDQFYASVAELMTEKFPGPDGEKVEFSTAAAEKLYRLVLNTNEDVKKNMPELRNCATSTESTPSS